MHLCLSGPLTTEQVTVPIPGLSAALKGTTLVQFSDFHFDGLRLSPRLLGQAITRSNHLEPDLVVLTGDFVTEDPAPIYPLATKLKQLRSRHGTYAVLGNHDDVTLEGRQMIMDALRRAGITVLWNDIAYPLGPDLPLVGLADLWSGPLRARDLLAQIPADCPRILLAHNPDTAAAVMGDRVDLQLSGHTHGGQILLPGIGPLPLLARRLRYYLPRWLRQHLPYLNDHCDRITRHWEWASGLHTVGDNCLYVNRGLGTYFPGRWRCPPELTVITLTPAPQRRLHPAEQKREAVNLTLAE
ncbi:metallophosphoesterase [Leptolyngbya sp. PCC 6406]|uniref:metallophosphoesterase n=1 Tax=Leptolyngbya sp. PCC 6406 TaxID=1173264 RepID=UPI0002AC97E3|nr:metallophosphoesterase [Leptolyngbya sp. PCC 6406]